MSQYSFSGHREIQESDLDQKKLEQAYGINLDKYNDVSSFMKAYTVERYKCYSEKKEGYKLKLADMLKNIPKFKGETNYDFEPVPIVGWGSDLKTFEYGDKIQDRLANKEDAMQVANYFSFLDEQFKVI